MAYGDRLRGLRAERQLSLRQVEERGGPNKDTMSLIERGEHKPRAQTLGRIAKALDMSVAELQAELEAGPTYPKVEASPSQVPLNGFLEEERRARFERWRAENARALALLSEDLANLEKQRAEGRPLDRELRVRAAVIVYASGRIIESTGVEVAAGVRRGDELDEVLGLLDAGHDVDANLRDAVEALMGQFAEALAMRGKVRLALEGGPEGAIPELDANVLDEHPNTKWATKLKLRAVA